MTLKYVFRVREWQVKEAPFRELVRGLKLSLSVAQVDDNDLTCRIGSFT